VLEANLTATTQADPQTARLTAQTFTSLLGTLIDDADTATQPAASKKLPTDADAYSAQLTNPPAPLAQPVIIPTTVLRLHFFFPATPSSKVVDTKSEDTSEGDNTAPDPSTPAATLTSTVSLPVAEPQPVPQQPAPPQPTVATPQSATSQTATPQAVTPQTPATQPGASATLTAAPAVPAKTPARPSFSQATLQPSSTSKGSTPTAADPAHTAAPTPVPQQSVAPVILAAQPSEPQPLSANTAAEPRSRTPQPTTAPIPVPVPSTQSSVEDRPNSSPNDSAAPQLSVNSNASTPLPHAELAFAAKLTISPPAQPVGQDATLTQAATSAAPMRASRTTLNIARPPTPAAAPAQAPNPSPAPARPQTDTDGDSDPAPDPTLRQLSKSQVKVQTDSPEPIIEASATEKPQLLPEAAPSVLTSITVAPTAEPNTLPSVVKTAPEPVSEPVDSRPDAAALPATNAAPKSEPVRDLSIRIGDSPSNQIDVKIQERAGEVHVAVLSSSPSLTTDLRQQVGDLVGKLDRAGYHAETFKPTSSTASQQASSQSDSGQQQGSASGEQQQQEDARQQFLGRQRKSNQSQWLQQMNGNFGPTAVEGIEKQ